MGLFDLPAPLFAIADRALRAFLSPSLTLIAWGLVSGLVSTWLYSVFSSQDRIATAKTEAEEARKALLAYDGDFDGALPLMMRSLRLSMRHLGLTAGPALAAGLPLLFLFVWLDNAYDYRTPAAGTLVTVRVVPRDSAVTWSPAIGAASEPGVWRVAWPNAGQPVRLLSADGREIARLPFRSPASSIRKFAWWNFLFGNPAGYLPGGSQVRSLEVGYPPLEFLAVGPDWLRGWELVCFAPAGLLSILLRFAFGIH